MAVSSPDMDERALKDSSPILIVDDDRKMQQALSELLTEAGFSVLHSATPEDALEHLRSHDISVLITYHKLNGTSGIELLTRAKAFKPKTERLLIGAEWLEDFLLNEIQPLQLLIHPWAKESFVQIVKDCFDRFRLRIEHEKLQTLFLSNQKNYSEAKGQIDSDKALGKKIHASLLLDNPPNDLHGISIALGSSTSSLLDGDFVTFFRPGEDLVDIVMGDVMGKGLPSALVGTAIKAEIARFAEPYLDRSHVFDHRQFWRDDLPSIKHVISKVHDSYVDRLMKLEYFISLFYGRLDLQKRTLSFIDCGFTNPLYFRKSSKKAIFIRCSHFPLGTVQYSEYSPFELQYEEGDFFVLYSDGVTEASSPHGELFGEKRLGELIESFSHLSKDDLAEKIKQTVIEFTQKDILDDDFTVLVVKIDQLCEIHAKNAGVAKFNSVLTQLDTVRSITREACLKAPGDVERLSRQLQLALDEIFTNIVMHGYDEKPGSPICIQFQYLKEELLIEVSDQGRSFNPYTVPPINLFGDRDHGYGWHLIRQIADRIVYHPKQTQTGWNHLQLHKRYYIKRQEIMELTETERNGILILCLEGESLDAKQVPEFKEKALKIIEEKGIDKVIFDLKKLQFIDSSGLGAFLSLMRQLHTRGGHLSIASMNKSVKTIFELVSMQKIFDCHDTLDHAFEAQTRV